MRYALADNFFNFARVDEETGWEDRADEVLTIHPDGAGVRKITLFSPDPAGPHERRECTIVMSPGQYPEKVIQTRALTPANMEGGSHTYSWAKHSPGRPTLPPKANIQLVKG